MFYGEKNNTLKKEFTKSETSNQDKKILEVPVRVNFSQSDAANGENLIKIK